MSLSGLGFAGSCLLQRFLSLAELLRGLVELRLHGAGSLGLGLLQCGLGGGVRFLGILERFRCVLDLLLRLGQFAGRLGAGRIRQTHSRLIAGVGLLAVHWFQVVECFLLRVEGSGDVAHLQGLGSFGRGLLSVVFLQVVRLVGNLLLQFLQIGGRVALLLVAKLLLGLIGLLLSPIGLLQCLGDLIGGIHWRNLLLKLGLVIRFLGLLVGQGLGHFLSCVLEILGRFLGVFGSPIELLGVQVLLGVGLLLVGLLNLLIGLGRRVLHLLADVLGFRLQRLLFADEVVGIVLLFALIGFLVGVFRLVGNLVLLLGELVKLVLGFLELGNFIAALLDCLGLLFQGLLGVRSGP